MAFKHQLLVIECIHTTTSSHISNIHVVSDADRPRESSNRHDPLEHKIKSPY